MKRFISLFSQDLLLAYRSGHVFITILLLAVMLALVIFLPRELKVHNELLLDMAPGQPLAAYLKTQGLGEGVVYIDEAAFRADLDRQPNKIGVIFSGGVDAPHFEIITQNVIAEQNIGLLKASLDQAVLELRGSGGTYLPVKLLRQSAPPPPFNLNLVPIILVFEVVLLGFFIASVMIFQEKQEGTLRAYRVSPSGSLNYILSKSALFLVLSLLYGLPVLLVAFGTGINYPLVLLLLLLSSLLMTLFSIAVAVFFRNLSEWFFVGVAILLVNSIPMLAYAFPTFAPQWITWIPSYPAVFATRNVIFHGSGLAEISPTLWFLITVNLAALAAAYTAVRFKLLREGR
jgi:ABC-type multidrug transport system permease subunit